MLYKIAVNKTKASKDFDSIEVGLFACEKLIQSLAFIKFNRSIICKLNCNVYNLNSKKRGYVPINKYSMDLIQYGIIIAFGYSILLEYLSYNKLANNSMFLDVVCELTQGKFVSLVKSQTKQAVYSLFFYFSMKIIIYLKYLIFFGQKLNP